MGVRGETKENNFTQKKHWNYYHLLFLSLLSDDTSNTTSLRIGKYTKTKFGSGTPNHIFNNVNIDVKPPGNCWTKAWGGKGRNGTNSLLIVGWVARDHITCWHCCKFSVFIRKCISDVCKESLREVIIKQKCWYPSENTNIISSNALKRVITDIQTDRDRWNSLHVPYKKATTTDNQSCASIMRRDL